MALQKERPRVSSATGEAVVSLAEYRQASMAKQEAKATQTRPASSFKKERPCKKPGRNIDLISQRLVSPHPLNKEEASAFLMQSAIVAWQIAASLSDLADGL